MKVIATDIEYDTDGEEVDLPDQLTMIIHPSNPKDEDEIMDMISDMISDYTGYCHNGFCWEILEK